jgi:transcription-repair coupling factor (superfamily II helicase)
MKAEELVILYSADGLTKTVSDRIGMPNLQRLHLKGLYGSSDALLSAALFRNLGKTQLHILHDKEEASYFHNDIQNLLPGSVVYFFPTSYKKPYQFEQTDNANVLQRAEVLNALTVNPLPSIIVSYPEALTEKVITKKSLVDNTFRIHTGEKLDISFLSEWLSSYDFEKNDFVYEAGQYAVRGGIIDIFSFSNEYPYRIELFGNEIESIRTFDPDTQLSVEKQQTISIIPNVQTRLLQETRESFFSFLPADSSVWIKDVQQTADVVAQSFDKATLTYEQLRKDTGENGILTAPENLYEQEEPLLQSFARFHTVEYGNQFYYPPTDTYTFKIKPQPSFNKEFKFLSEDLREKQENGYINIIAAESYKQTDRLTTIFEETDAHLNFRPMHIGLREGFVDEHAKIVCYTDHQIFERFHRYKTREKYSRSKAITLKELRTLQAGDYVTHMDYGIARFAGLEKVENDGKIQEAIRLVFKDNDLLYISIHQLHKISRFSGKDGALPQLSKMGSGEWEAKKNRVKKQVKDIAKELIRLYALRKAAPGYAYSKDTFLQAELESSFLYEDTPDQAKATNDVKIDMEAAHPMDRLVCGDVGFGKTEIAVRAAFKAVCDNKQVAILVPTTVLAMQHYKTFHERLKKFPCIVEYINRFKTSTQIKETLKRVAEGKTNILIGTHKLIGKEVSFKDLGLLIIDEEQKFGVKVKERLREFKVNVDTLTLTATPIPRTLHFSLMGARDLSIIATPPPNRQPVTTEIHLFEEELIRDAIAYELKRGGQAFFVHNRIADIEDIAGTIKRLVPDAKIAVGHGQMEGDKLEKIMMGFVEGDYDVLVSTNIIESGLDIPNANTIIINRAHMFGLSDLHQMRGRVGRSNKKAFCYILTPAVSSLSSDSRKRLNALEEFSDLGDGFKVAMRDLDIRGAGNLLGAEQSGFISDLGFEMYHKILDEAIQELKETDFRELFKNELEQRELKALSPDCSIETDLSILIPDAYVTNITERLSLYSSIDNLKSVPELDMLRLSLTDRFGPIPAEVEDLLSTVQMRWKAEKLGFEKLVLKNGILKGYFVPSENESYYKSEVFGTILSYVQQHSKQCRLKEVSKKLILFVDPIRSIEKASTLLEDILSLVPAPAAQK